MIPRIAPIVLLLAACAGPRPIDPEARLSPRRFVVSTAEDRDAAALDWPNPAVDPAAPVAVELVVVGDWLGQDSELSDQLEWHWETCGFANVGGWGPIPFDPGGRAWLYFLVHDETGYVRTGQPATIGISRELWLHGIPFGWEFGQASYPHGPTWAGRRAHRVLEQRPELAGLWETWWEPTDTELVTAGPPLSGTPIHGPGTGPYPQLSPGRPWRAALTSEEAIDELVERWPTRRSEAPGAIDVVLDGEDELWRGLEEAVRVHDLGYETVGGLGFFPYQLSGSLQLVRFLRHPAVAAAADVEDGARQSEISARLWGADVPFDWSIGERAWVYVPGAELERAREVLRAATIPLHDPRDHPPPRPRPRPL